MSRQSLAAEPGVLRDEPLQILDIALQAARALVHVALARAELDARHVLRLRNAFRHQNKHDQFDPDDHQRPLSARPGSVHIAAERSAR